MFGTRAGFGVNTRFTNSRVSVTPAAARKSPGVESDPAPTLKRAMEGLNSRRMLIRSMISSARRARRSTFAESSGGGINAWRRSAMLSGYVVGRNRGSRVSFGRSVILRLVVDLPLNDRAGDGGTGHQPQKRAPAALRHGSLAEQGNGRTECRRDQGVADCPPQHRAGRRSRVQPGQEGDPLARSWRGIVQHGATSHGSTWPSP